MVSASLIVLSSAMCFMVAERMPVELRRSGCGLRLWEDAMV